MPLFLRLWRFQPSFTRSVHTSSLPFTIPPYLWSRILPIMPLPSPQPVTLTNWSKSARSACLVLPVRSADELAAALAGAAARGQTVIAHGAGHSYTDAALNSGGLVLDLRPMNRILSWEPDTG